MTVTKRRTSWLARWLESRNIVSRRLAGMLIWQLTGLPLAVAQRAARDRGGRSDLLMGRVPAGHIWQYRTTKKNHFHAWIGLSWEKDPFRFLGTLLWRWIVDSFWLRLQIIKDTSISYFHIHILHSYLEFGHWEAMISSNILACSLDETTRRGFCVQQWREVAATIAIWEIRA